MSVFKTTFSRAINAYPSDFANIPSPTVITSGTNTAVFTDKLEDSTTDFINDNIQAGDIVYNVTTKTSATIIKVIGGKTLELNADIFTTDPEDYIIYQASSQTGLGNPGCYLYIGQASDNNGIVTVTTIGGDIVSFYGVANGTVLPIQVIKLHLSNTLNISEILALW